MPRIQKRSARPWPGWGSEPVHVPVLVQEVLQQMRCGSGGIFMDATVGAGGHAEAILKASDPDGRLIGMDRDGEALAVARARLNAFGDRVALVHEDYRNLDRVFLERGVGAVDGILFDLGVSSLQLSDPERGFSFQEAGPLDMRMDRRAGRTAGDFVNRMSEEELADILYHYGQERGSRRIARAIVRERERGPIETTEHLAEIIRRAVPPPGRYGRIHPATRSFQALRIAVNEELRGLSETLSAAAERLSPGGRVLVIAFHSLEDRIVKQTFRSLAQKQGSAFRLITKKPIVPTAEETDRNPRSRSAKLRVIERAAA